MSEVVGFAVEGVGEIYAELPDNDVGVARASRGGDLLHSTADVDGALDQVKTFASGVLDKFRTLPRQPDEVELEFGLKLNAAAGVVIARTEAEAHLTVKLTWSKPSPDQDDAGS
jgi:hypothetical protein